MLKLWKTHLKSYEAIISHMESHSVSCHLTSERSTWSHLT